MSEGAPKRLAALDGLRGWAALSVVVYHLSWELFGTLYPPVRNILVAMFANGELAVALFLMVSGYVLTIQGWRGDKAGVRRSILKRYFRLTIPIVASVLIFWAVIAFHWVASPDAAVIVHSSDWLNHFGDLQPDFLDALSFGLVTVYVHATPASYGPFLWTMTIELWGSYLVLVLCWFELPGRWAYLPVSLLTVLGLASSWAPYLPIAACYPAGALVALLSKDRLFPSTSRPPVEGHIATVLFAAVIVVAAIVQATGGGTRVTALLAILAFVAALRSARVTRFLSRPISQWLGRISFPLYLLQVVVITTLASQLIVLTNNAGLLTPWTAFGISVVSLAACLAMARLFMPVEHFALSSSAAIGRRLRA